MYYSKSGTLSLSFREATMGSTVGVLMQVNIIITCMNAIITHAVEPSRSPQIPGSSAETSSFAHEE